MRTLIISTLLLLSTLSCRVRHSSASSTSHNQRETIEYLDIWQIAERYDTLGRLVERQRSELRHRHQDSSSLTTTTHSEHSSQTTNARAKLSIKALTISLIIGFALGCITILYLRQRLRRLRQIE